VVKRSCREVCCWKKRVKKCNPGVVMPTTYIGCSRLASKCVQPMMTNMFQGVKRFCKYDNMLRYFDNNVRARAKVLQVSGLQPGWINPCSKQTTCFRQSQRATGRISSKQSCGWRLRTVKCLQHDLVNYYY